MNLIVVIYKFKTEDNLKIRIFNQKYLHKAIEHFHSTNDDLSNRVTTAQEAVQVGHYITKKLQRQQEPIPANSKFSRLQATTPQTLQVRRVFNAIHITAILYMRTRHIRTLIPTSYYKSPRLYKLRFPDPYHTASLRKTQIFLRYVFNKKTMG